MCAGLRPWASKSTSRQGVKTSFNGVPTSAGLFLLMVFYSSRSVVETGQLVHVHVGAGDDSALAAALQTRLAADDGATVAFKSPHLRRSLS